MNLTVEIPDDLVGRLNAAGGDLPRRALVALALEEYKSGHITKAEMPRVLGFSTRHELDGFLKAREVWADADRRCRYWASLGAGEGAAILLAVEFHAGLLLIDNREGVTPHCAEDSG